MLQLSHLKAWVVGALVEELVACQDLLSLEVRTHDSALILVAGPRDPSPAGCDSTRPVCFDGKCLRSDSALTLAYCAQTLPGSVQALAWVENVPAVYFDPTRVACLTVDLTVAR